MDDVQTVLEQKILEANELLQRKDIVEKLPERLYTALEGISSLFLAWKKGQGKQGWSRILVDRQGQSLFTEEQAATVESAFQRLEPTLQHLFDVQPEAEQTGGAPPLHRGDTGPLVQVPFSINPEDASIDKLWKGITGALDQYDEQWKQIADSFKIVKTIEGVDYRGIIPGPVPIPYWIPGKSVLPLVNLFLDLIRLALGNPMLDLPMIRILLSTVLGLLDLIRGDWQNAILSLSGILGSGFVVLGFFGKLLRNALLMIEPDLRKQLRDDIYKSGKSMVIGSLLYLFSILSPDVVRNSVNIFFENIRTMLDQVNVSLEDIDQQLAKAAAPMGLQVTLPRVPLSIVPNMDDIQNLQMLAKNEAFICSAQGKKILEPLLLVPPLRLVLELLNIPTLPEDREIMCKGVSDDLADAVAEQVAPSVEIIPGGPIDQATKAAAQAEAALSGAVPALPTVPKLPIGGRRGCQSRHKKRGSKRSSSSKTRKTHLRR